MKLGRHDLYEVTPTFPMLTPGGDALGPLKPHLSIRERGSAGFLKWLRLEHPRAYRNIKRRRPDLLSGGPASLGTIGAFAAAVTAEEDQAPADPGLMSQLFALAKGFMGSKHELEMAKINAASAEAGESPKQSTITETELDITRAPIQAGFGNMLPFLAVAGVGTLIFMFARSQKFI